jgi:hypothetical protein
LPDSGFSFGGLRPRSNLLTIDGLDNNDEFTGSSRTELSLEIVREFQVVNNGWSAENGGASGGSINVVTKSGTNIIHGDAFLFGQSGRLNASPKLEETLGQKPSLERYRGGLAIGGPLRRDRTFYYAAAEREQTSDETASEVDLDAASAINSALAAGLLPQVATRQLTVGLFPTARFETEWSAKVTQQLERGALIMRIASTDARDEHDAFNSGGLADRSARGSATTRDLAVTGAWTTVYGSRTTNELRGQVATRRSEWRPTDEQGPAVSIAGTADFGRAYVGSSTHDQRYLELDDTVGYSRGSHFLKAGGNLRRVALTGTSNDGLGGVLTFPTLDAFLAGQPDTFRQVSHGADLDLTVTRASAFVQDRWTPTSGLTIDTGLRVDASVFPSSLDITNRQVSPRAGVAWTPRDHWIIRGGAGLFADRLVLAALERAWVAQQSGVVEQIVGNPLVVAPSVYTVRPGAWNPFSRQASIGAERQLAANLTASVNYLFVQGRNLARTANINLPPPTMLTDGRPVFGPDRLNPSFDGVFELQPTAASVYHGVTMALNRRLANELEWSAAYTWSHARDSASDFDEQPQNPYALADEWSDARSDQRHRLVISALFDLPIGEAEDRTPGTTPGMWSRAFSDIEVAPILTIGSGNPVNVTTGGDDNHTGAFPFTSRPLGVGRNSLRMPSSATLDLRVLKSFNIKPHGKLDFVVEAFNLLNRTNVTQVNAVFGPGQAPLPSFGRPIGAAAARQLQFSIDFEF